MIVIDMQNDFCAKGGLVDHRGADYTPDRKPIKPLQKLLPALRKAGVPVIWVNWGNRPNFADIPGPTRSTFTSPRAPASGWAIRCPATARRCCRRICGWQRSSTSFEQEPHDIKVDKYRISGSGHAPPS